MRLVFMEVVLDLKVGTEFDTQLLGWSGGVSDAQ